MTVCKFLTIWWMMIVCCIRREEFIKVDMWKKIYVRPVEICRKLYIDSYGLKENGKSIVPRV